MSAARAAAFDILLRVERESSYASELLHAHDSNEMKVVDHALSTELVMGVLRWRSLLDSQIAEQSSQPLSKIDVEVLTALRMGLYQLRWLDRIPASAAINESVELVKRARKRSAATFVNAVLRQLSAVPKPKSEDPRPLVMENSSESLSTNSAHPRWLVERWIAAYGFEATVKMCEYDQSVPVTAIRLRQPDAEAQLRRAGVILSPGAFLASARRVAGGDIRNAFVSLRGQFAVQDEASQLVAALVGQGDRVLDCCAAPGGKTLAIADRNTNAQISAVELHPHRAGLLRRLLADKNRPGDLQCSKIQVVAGDARSLPFAGRFDRVLADVPCSGTGTLARNPEIKWRLTASDLADLQSRQLAIVRSAMDRVSAGGRLIYSTCSLEKEENEDVIERVLSENPSFRLIDCRVALERLRSEGELVWPEIASLTSGPFLRTLPGVHPCDGFFAAILQSD